MSPPKELRITRVATQIGSPGRSLYVTYLQQTQDTPGLQRMIFMKNETVAILLPMGWVLDSVPVEQTVIIGASRPSQEPS
jgi:hypothetical protein